MARTSVVGLYRLPRKAVRKTERTRPQREDDGDRRAASAARRVTPAASVLVARRRHPTSVHGRRAHRDASSAVSLSKSQRTRGRADGTGTPSPMYRAPRSAHGGVATAERHLGPKNPEAGPAAAALEAPCWLLVLVAYSCCWKLWNCTA